MIVQSVTTKSNAKNRDGIAVANREKRIAAAREAERKANRNREGYKHLYDRIEELEAENEALKQELEAATSGKSRVKKTAEKDGGDEDKS